MLTPRKYQEQGIKFLYEHKRAGVFDAPGLGKTLQAAMAAEETTLVACPTYLMDQWAEFIADQFPAARVSLAQGTVSERAKALARKADWYIVNIEMLRSYPMPKVKTFIIDESHHVRGRNSQQAEGAFNTAKVTDRVYLLTATPIYTEPDDLFMQFKLLDPKHFTSYWNFVNQYCKILPTPWGNKVKGTRDPKALAELIKKYAICRGYKDVGLELPNLIESVIRVQPSAAFMKDYKELKKSYVLQGLVMQSIQEAIQTLRVMTNCKEKLDALDNLIKDTGRGSKIVIFCWYHDTAFFLGKHLSIPVVTGDMQASERRKIAQQSSRVVATVASLSEGIDLSDHKMVIFYEEDYTPGMMYQTISRVRRYSVDSSPVRAYTITLKGTVDDVVHSSVVTRSANAKEILRRALA